ncbi:unnamed protein product [Lymnaea stagnalis]|uniref:G-protein coupled receptors family 1 profile domain-containing protein n=1 Tax=Lymnaea stagnalis TaxID=6523 RepID=A0AAV2H4W8_LYMST
MENVPDNTTVWTKVSKKISALDQYHHQTTQADVVELNVEVNSDHLTSEAAILYSPHNISTFAWFNVSCSFLQMPEDFIKNIVEPIIVCFGIFGILLTLVVLTRKCMSNSCNCYLTALAIGDLMFLLIMSSKILMDKLADCHFMTGPEMTVFGIYSIICMDIFQYMTVGVTVMLAVERYIAICHPMRAMGMCTVKRARMVIVGLAVIAFILLCPKFTDIGLTKARMMSGEEISVFTYQYSYNNVIYTYVVIVCLLTVIPLVTLLILNGRIIYEIRRSSRYLQNYLGVDWRVRSIVSSDELKITMMLVSVVLAFFACHSPYMVYIAVMAVKEFDTVDHSELTSSASLTYFRHVCHSLLALKSSCNFVLYCWFSDKFWATFKRTFCHQRCPGRQLVCRSNSFNNNGHHCRFGSHAHPLRSSYYVSKETTC